MTAQGGKQLSISDLYARLKREIGFADPSSMPYIIPTGSSLLDRATGIGGYPGGRIVELYGLEMAGKTTLAMHACVEAERMGLSFAYIDMERSLDLAYFERMGLKGKENADWLHVVPETGEDSFGVLRLAIEAGVSLLVFDSVAAMVPAAEYSDW